MILLNNKIFLRLVLIFIILIAYILMPIIDRLSQIKTKYQSASNYISSYSNETRYNQLADSFLSGQLNLKLEPPAKLLALPDPYDPKANFPFRLNGFSDVSLYKGKLYLYFGLTPVITLYIPYKLLTNKKLPDRLATLIFTFGALTWSILILLYIQNQFFKQIPEWMILLSIGVLGFANLGLFLMRDAKSYQLTISCGNFFLMGSIFLLLYIENLKTFKWWTFYLLGSFLGLLAGSKPHYIFSTLALFLISILLVLKSNFKSSVKLKSLFFIITPLALCLTTIALYNYLRFEDIAEFGFRYQFSWNNSPLLHQTLYSFTYIIENLSFYLFKPGIGLIIYNPLTILSLLILFIDLALKQNNLFFQKSNVKFPTQPFLIILIPGCISFIFLLLFSITSYRFPADFLCPLLLANLIFWFYSYCRFGNNLKVRKLLQVIGGILGIVSIYWGISLTYVKFS